MYSRAAINEHFLIKRPFEERPRTAFSKKIESFFKLLADRKFYVESVAISLQIALLYLRSDPNSLQSPTKKQSLLALCKERPNLFLNLDIYNLLIDAVRREYTSSFKTRANPAYCHCCSELLASLFKDIERLPIELLQVICDDWAYDSIWIDCCTEVEIFCNSVLSFFFPHLPSTSTLHSFSNEKLLEIKYYIIGSIQSFGEMSSFRSLKTAQRSSMLNFITLGCKYAEVRRSCFDFLPEWCSNSHFQVEVKRLFLNFCSNLDCISVGSEFELEMCKEIVSFRKIKEPVDLLMEGIWLLIQRNMPKIDTFLECISSNSPSLIQSHCYRLFDKIAVSCKDFSKIFFSFVQKQPSNPDIIPFLVECNKYPSSMLSSIIEHLCLNFDKLDYRFEIGLNAFSLLIVSLVNSENTSISLIASIVQVFIHGYLRFHCKELTEISADLFSRIIGLFQKCTYLPISHTNTLSLLHSQFCFSPIQFAQLTLQLLENTIRCMVKFNYAPQKDSFDECFVSWLTLHALSSIQNDAIKTQILLAVTAIAPEVIGRYVWNEFEEMKNIICNAICEGSFSNNDSNINNENSAVPYCKLLCMSREPDFLQEFIANAKASRESFDILVRLLQFNEHIIHSLPAATAINLTIYLEQFATFPTVKARLLKRMEIYLETTIPSIIDWIISHSEPYERIKGYNLLAKLLHSPDYFSTLTFLSKKFPQQLDMLVSWNLKYEIEQNILRATIKLVEKMKNFEISLDPIRKEELASFLAQIDCKIPLLSSHSSSATTHNHPQSSIQFEPIEPFFTSNTPYRFITSPSTFSISTSELDEEAGEIPFKLPVLSSKPFISQTFPIALQQYFLQERFNLSAHFKLLRLAYDSPQSLITYFDIIMQKLLESPSFLFKVVDIFSTCISKISSIPTDSLRRLIEIAFFNSSSTSSIESTLRLCHNYLKTSPAACYDTLRKIQHTHLQPRAHLYPTIISPMIESLNSQKPFIIYREECFTEQQKSSISKTLQSILDCTAYSSSVFTAALRCIDDLLSLSSAYPEILKEISPVLIPLLFINCAPSETADRDEQFLCTLKTIRNKGYELILRLLSADPSQLAIVIGFVNSLASIDHDSAFTDMVLLLCPDFCADIRLRQLYLSIKK